MQVNGGGTAAFGKRGDGLSDAELIDNSGKNSSGQGRIGRAIRSFFHRPPKMFGRANGATAPPPPDSPPAIRSADGRRAYQTEPRLGGHSSAEGGTIFFDGTGDLATESLFETKNISGAFDRERRVVLWMRAGDPTLRAVTIDGTSADTDEQLAREESGDTSEIDIALQEGFHVSRGKPEPPRRSMTGTIRPLMVWTVWTNPLCE